MTGRYTTENAGPASGWTKAGDAFGPAEPRSPHAWRRRRHARAARCGASPDAVPGPEPPGEATPGRALGARPGLRSS